MSRAGSRVATTTATAVVLLGCASVLVPMRVVRDPELWDALLNAAHFPLFVVMTWAFAVLGERWTVLRGSTVGAVGGAATVLLIELVQPLVGRSASLGDLRNGLCGVVATVTGLVIWRVGSRSARALHLVLCAGALALMLIPAGGHWRAIGWRADRFPALGEFESELELRLWQPQGSTPRAPTRLDLSTERVRCGRRALRVRPGGGAWPGVHYLAGDVGDWNDFDRLAFELYNTGPPFELTLRIDDRASRADGSRFQRRLRFEPGWSSVTIPIEEIRAAPRRPLELGSIRRMLLFGRASSHLPVFFIDHVRLTDRPASPDDEC